MDSLVKPIERVVEAAEWFLRTPALRVLHVVTSGLLRAPVLRHLTAAELLDFNTCPFFVLEAPTEADDDGWGLRADELRADWEGLRDGAPVPDDVAPLWPVHGEQPPVARFAHELHHALGLLRAPMTGLVIVLAPVWVRDAARWCGDLAALLPQKELAKARFVIVEAETPAALPVIEELGPLAERVDARIDDAQLGDDAAASVAALMEAPPGATGYQLVGAAGPPEPPPARRNAPAPLSPAQREQLAAEIGVSAALMDPDVMRSLRVLVLSAAAAVREGDWPLAVRRQVEAREFCVGHALAREAVVNEMVLAGYVLQAGQAERALEIFRQARQRAEQAKLTELAVQAQLAVGSCLLVVKKTDEAIVAYVEAGQLGAGAGTPVLAIEAFRMAGQLLMGQRRFEEGTVAFRRAIETAQAAGDDVGRASSAPEAARALAVVCRKYGLAQQADALEAQAVEMEKPAPALEKENSVREPPAPADSKPEDVKNA